MSSTYAVIPTPAAAESIPTNEKMTMPVSTKRKEARDLQWSNVNFTVDGKTTVLKDCWGEVKAGQVCAVLGPSRAGKTSLLNVLAGRVFSSSKINISASVKVGGKEINPVTFRKQIAYVMQEDSLLPTATPRESFRFSASLRLPSSLSVDEINEKAEKLLDDLGLLECADVLCGNQVIKGISGGQKKRTCVGVEIITDPTLLFLDEPTTGLDSFSAFNLLKILKKLSTNCAILCTIHQPSSEIFFLFDKAIYLKDGYIFYQGETDGIVHYFENKGYGCPENYNPADFVMNLCQSMTMEELTEKNLLMIEPDQLASEKLSVQHLTTVAEFTAESSFWKQLYVITGRSFVDMLRDYPALIGRFGVTTILGLIFGLIFMGSGSRDNADSDQFNSHVGSLSMVTIMSMFGTAQSVLLSFPFERPMILREYVTGTYNMEAYFLSKSFIELPLCFLQMLYLFILTYFLIDFRGNFIIFVLTGWILGLTSNSLAMVLGCAIPDVKSVTELSPLLYMPQVLFGGFFVRTQQIPQLLRWAQYLCGLKYAMNLQFYNEFREGLPACDESEAAAENCQGLLDSNDIKSTDLGLYVMGMILLCVGYRVIGVSILHYSAKSS